MWSDLHLRVAWGEGLQVRECPPGPGQGRVGTHDAEGGGLLDAFGGRANGTWQFASFRTLGREPCPGRCSG